MVQRIMAEREVGAGGVAVVEMRRERVGRYVRYLSTPPRVIPLAARCCKMSATMPPSSIFPPRLVCRECQESRSR